MNTAEKVLEALKPFDLKPDGKNKYRANSPIRPGSNSHAFALTIDDGEHGAYHDHVSGDSGSLYDLAKLLGVAAANPSAVSSTKRKYSGLEDYARAHGLSVGYLQAWFWRETVYKNRPALEFQTRTGPRWRFLDGEKPHYISTPGYERCWYGLNDEVVAWLRTGAPLVICNGEISTIAAQFAGVAAIAMTGGEKAEIPTHLVDELKGRVSGIDGLQVLVAMDCDSTGAKAAAGISAQLLSVGFNVRAVDLGLGIGGDLADFCMLHSADAAGALESLPALQSPAAELPQYSWEFFTVDQLFKLPPVEWLIPRKIPTRGVCTIFGPSGAGKSFVTLDFALSIAQDKPVVYIAAEGESGYASRVRAWMKHHNQSYGKLTFVLGAVNMFEDDEFDYFQQRLAAYQPVMLVIDTFAMCMGDADENNAKEMMKLVRAAKQLSAALSCAVVLVHHTNKEGVKERGSGRLRDSSETMIRVTREDNDLLRVKSEKTKDSAAFDAYYLREIVISLEGRDSLGEPLSSLVYIPAEMVETSNALTERQRAILEAIQIEPEASLSEIATVVEAGRGSVQKIIKHLTGIGYLQIDGKARRLTDKGVAALGDSTDSTDSADSTDSTDSTKQPNAEMMESQESGSQLAMFGKPSKNNYRDGY